MRPKQIFTIIFIAASSILFGQKNSSIKISDTFSNESLTLVFLDWKIKYRLSFDYSFSEIKDVMVSGSFRKTPL